MTFITWIQETLFCRTTLLSLCVFWFMKSFYFIYSILEILKRVNFVFGRCFLPSDNKAESCILALVADDSNWDKFFKKFSQKVVLMELEIHSIKFCWVFYRNVWTLNRFWNKQKFEKMFAMWKNWKSLFLNHVRK